MWWYLISFGSSKNGKISVAANTKNSGDIQNFTILFLIMKFILNMDLVYNHLNHYKF